MARRLTLAQHFALALAPATAAAQPRVPFGFFGVNAGGGTLLEHGDLESEFDLMLGTGVQSVRQPFQWEWAQPYASWADVPPDRASQFRDEAGMPTDWTLIDRQVAAAARRRMAVLAVVHGVPEWAARYPGQSSSPPRDARQFAAWMATLARRYGPDGTFWAEHPELPRVPVRDWQVWNEPSLVIFWSDRPWAPGYVELLRASRDAVRAVDPGGRIVLAGFPNDSWNALNEIYKAGGRGLFDAMAVHPFTAWPQGVVQIVRKVRKVMAAHGDRKIPLMVTETAWTSSKGRIPSKDPWQVTERGQARRVTQLLRMLAGVRRRLGVERVYWYTWMTTDSEPDYSFDYAGLRRLRGAGPAESKPALAAYRRTALGLSGCPRKTVRADRCG
ncbi:MAG: polysaccharide biosynthesis protein PslG [Thermoleophilales bacterium]|nr:polysaccharide biosynthesis protein PslG [Thermoleophilales bacterium]